MSEFEEFDWADTYDSASVELLPPGEYQVECFEATATSSSKGNPMIRTRYRVVDGPYAGRTLFDQHTLSISNQMALSLFFRRMKAFGLGEEFFKSLPRGDLGAVANSLVGRKVTAKVKHDTWEDEVREKVSGLKPPASGQTPVTAASAQQSTPSIFGMPNVGGVPALPTQGAPLSMPSIPALPTPALKPVPTQITPQAPDQELSASANNPEEATASPDVVSPITEPDYPV